MKWCEVACIPMARSTFDPVCFGPCALFWALRGQVNNILHRQTGCSVQWSSILFFGGGRTKIWFGDGVKPPFQGPLDLPLYEVSTLTWREGGQSVCDAVSRIQIYAQCRCSQSFTHCAADNRQRFPPEGPETAGLYREEIVLFF